MVCKDVEIEEKYMDVDVVDFLEKVVEYIVVVVPVDFTVAVVLMEALAYRS